MGHEHADRPFPRGVLIGAGLLLALSVALAAASRWTGIGQLEDPVSATVERLAIGFEDRSDGSVTVFAVDDGREVARLAPGTNGFIRSVVRGLARERRARGIGSEPAFWLTRRADGRLSLDDPSTGRSVELGAFGPTNAEAFADLLVAGRTP